ncbi:MAG: redox-active disulfide protein 2 [Candidatus Glassbacteria bacterium RBG_16_58_8]|uniref:Redox-active disulfide protein 2 n=1 Tax=Candidatus Glassbacteria bacterium RBG_16_58_8 TaxID=1817866 RepID=A0A1F5YCC1_9BACT|nr:MAG: redox-active disulfide protein 2 [Candidatus Glassbacteria bacterium RBG_16_58_8]
MKKLQVLGPGCSRCRKLADNTENAAKELGIEYELEKITDINILLGYGIMRTPALVIDGEVKMTGKVPSVEEIKRVLAG